MKTLVPALLALSLLGSVPTEPSIDYRFDEVRRNVVRTSATQELRVQRGDRAQSGDRVQTGWFSYALIASDRYRAKFEIFSSTNVQLAGGTPGVILTLERGRLHAIFDKITGNEPRVVQTPGALLAVRGTQYVANVDADGKTTLDVYEGIVEVRSETKNEPVLVHAGEESVFGRHEPPVLMPMPPDHRQPGRMGEPDRDPHGMGPGGRDPHGMGPDTDADGREGHGMPGMSPPSSPTPQPQPKSGHH